MEREKKVNYIFLGSISGSKILFGGMTQNAFIFIFKELNLINTSLDLIKNLRKIKKAINLIILSWNINRKLQLLQYFSNLQTIPFSIFQQILQKSSTSQTQQSLIPYCCFDSSSSMKQTQSTITFSPYHSLDSDSFLKKQKRPLEKKIRIPIDQKLLPKQNQKEEPTLQKLIFDPFETHYIERSGFRTPDLQIVNHDIELKEYLSGKKLFLEKNMQLEDFYKKEEPIFIQNQKQKLKHKKQKSKSQIALKNFSHSSSQLISICNLNTFNHKESVQKENTKTQIENFVEKKRKLIKPSKTVKYLDLNLNQEITRNNELKSFEIYRLLKKATSKDRIGINDVMRKFNLPKLNSVFENNLETNVGNQNKSKPANLKLQTFNSKNGEKRNHKMSTTNLPASISKLQQNRIKELIKLQRQIILTKRKSNQLKNR